MNWEADVRVWLGLASRARGHRGPGAYAGKFDAISDLSLPGEVREKGIVVYDAVYPECTPAVALREHRAKYKSAEEEEKSV